MTDLSQAGTTNLADDPGAGLSFDTPAQHIAYLEKALLKQKELLARNQKMLMAIYSSHGWRILSAYYRLRERVVPPQSLRRAVVKRLFHLALGLGRRGSTAGAAGTIPPFHEGYARWIRKYEPTKAELEQQRRARFALEPRISIIVPTYNTPAKYLEAMIQSVLAQTYGNWELCIADGASTDDGLKERLRGHCRSDAHIRLDFLPVNKGIAGNSNAALDLATGEFVALLDHDDTLAPFALFEVVRALNEHLDADLIYSDEDKIDETGRHRFEPHFKPDWSPDTLRSHNYICHLSVFRHELLQRVGRFRSGFDGSQDYDAILRVSEQARAIVHIPRVLYHWRVHPASVAGDTGAKMYAYESGKKALAEHLQRRHVAGSVLYGPILGTYQVTYALPRRPLVSIIIPNRDHADVLQRCLDSIARSSHERYEILLVENQSKNSDTFQLYRQLQEKPNLRLLTWTQPFNYAAVNNFAASQAHGDVLLFLNNDVEAINADWMERLLEHALRSEVGAVGAKLYYPNDTVQHGGVIVGLRGTAGHAHAYHPRNSPGYFARLIVTHNVSAVTAACLMVRKSVFEEVKGFDERFIVAFNDIDLCLKLRQRGYLVIWTPHAELYHHESLTRGPDVTDTIHAARFEGEGDLLITKWSDWIERGDPYYNPNLDLIRSSFALKN